jgi:hypothetical protein
MDMVGSSNAYYFSRARKTCQLIRKTNSFSLDLETQTEHNKWALHTAPMKSSQLAKNLRYIPLSDEGGAFGLFVVHDGDQVRYTIQVEDYDEFRATVESFQEQPA